MLVYPQLANGAISQFPIQKRRRVRTIVNTADDDTTIKLADPGAEILEWQLSYAGLNDSELATLTQFWVSTEGTLLDFTFLDPTANVLARSADLNNSVWNKGPFLSTVGDLPDPHGGSDAWTVANSGGGTQQLSQTVMAPGSYLYCFSAWARSSVASNLTMWLGSTSHSMPIGPQWTRIVCVGTGDAAATSVTFAIELAAGLAVDLYGLQVDPQASPSAYKATSIGGCYENARFRDDGLSFTTTDVNCHTATVKIIHASHL